jgi:cystathionine beta-lyase/cystathionine gamma-synthase
MLAVELAGGEAVVGSFLNALELPTIAVSLGDVSTLIWPIAGSGLVRISVGLEDLADLEADFGHALDQLST